MHRSIIGRTYGIKNQRRARNSPQFPSKGPSRGLWMPELVLYGIRELALAIPRKRPRHRGGPLWLAGRVNFCLANPWTENVQNTSLVTGHYIYIVHKQHHQLLATFFPSGLCYMPTILIQGEQQTKQTFMITYHIPIYTDH